MKISGNNYEINKYLSEPASKEAQRTEEVRARGKEPASATTPSGQDVIVELSQRSQEVQMAREAIEQQPDMREEKIQALKAQVENGTFEVNPEKIADKMMRLFMDETG